MSNNINEYVKNGSCCGCGVCLNICPKKAISMQYDDEGFLSPVIEADKCVNCGLCKQMCAFNSTKPSENEVQVYAVKNKNDDIRKASRSGGTFTAIATNILSKKGVVYGVALNEKNLAEHIRIENESELAKLRGSKYIQSDTQKVYELVKNDLKMGKTVLYTGTGCQIASMKKYLKNEDTQNLFLVDIVCHGVPSAKIWLDFLADMEEKNHSKITDINFRNKQKYGWEGSTQTFIFNDKEIDSNMYLDLFTSGVIERDSCFKCPYKSINREGDITLGDFWGIDKLSTEFNDHKGVSLVLCNSEKGKNLFEEIVGDLLLVRTDLEHCKQQALSKPINRPVNKDLFWKKYRKKGMRYLKHYYLMFRIKRKLGK